MAEPEELPLSDDALLAVLAFLSPRELIGCRLVCRRFRDLCVHPDLWRSVELSNAGLLRAALHLAPCLGEISLLDEHVGSLQAVGAVVSSMTCAVARVSFTFLDQACVTLVTDITRKLIDLGGLRALVLHSMDEVEFSPSFFEMIYRMNDLFELEFRSHTTSLSCTSFATEVVKPSLVKLTYGYSVDPFIELLLKIHAATLEKVSLFTGGRLPFALKYIAAPKLRSLACHLNDDLAYSEALSNLHTLTLIAYAEYPFPPRALEFLRSSSQLRSVHFTFVNASPSPTAPLLALAASASAPALESLSIKCASDPLMAMTSTLHRFPSLQSVTLSRMSSITLMSPDAELTDNFLRAVSPVSVPCLTSLKMDYVQGCPHSWLHGPAVQDLLARNPRLHLHLDPDGIPGHCDCHWCRWGCHAELKTTAGLRRAFASHTKRAGCPRNCFRWPCCLSLH